VSHVVELPLDGGEVVFVEVAEEDAGLDRVGRPATVLREASETLESALRRTRPAVQAVLNEIRQIAEPPDRITLTFGIKFTAAAGVVVAQASSEGNFEVTVEWTRQSSTRTG
jgi:hypothetical protein